MELSRTKQKKAAVSLQITGTGTGAYRGSSLVSGVIARITHIDTGRHGDKETETKLWPGLPGDRFLSHFVRIDCRFSLLSAVCRWTTWTACSPPGRPPAPP